jgi:hypothetical protein
MLPPKESIREIRINSNPFSPEYDTLGYGRIEIFTKPGTDKFHGTAFYNFGDDFWNSRNPYAAEKASAQASACSTTGSLWPTRLPPCTTMESLSSSMS